MFGLSGSPFGLTGTLGPPGGPQFGLTMGPGTLSPSFSAGHLTGNPEVDTAISAALNTGGKQGLSLAGLPSQLSASLLAALTHAPQVVGFVGGLISTMSAPFSLVSLAHSIASMSPTSVASLQAALANPNPESQVSLDQALAIMSGAQMGPTYGGPQAPSSSRGYSGGVPSLGPQGAAFGLDFSNPSVRSGFEANQPSTARTDVGVPGATAEGPGISGAPPGGAIGAGAPGAGLGEGGPGGPGPGAPSDGATGGGTDAGEA